MMNKIPCTALVALVFLTAACRAADVQETQKTIGDRFADAAKSADNVKTAALLVHSHRHGVHWKYAYGTVDSAAGPLVAGPDQPFHVASVGKTFTAVLVLQLMEEGRLKLSDTAESILGPQPLEGLFLFQGKDYRAEVTIEHLLTHTSGAADYFESTDEDDQGPSVFKEIVRDHDRFWTPQDLLDFSRKHQKAVGRPGSQFHYSDTGYILLGMIIEKIAQKRFEDVLAERFFRPLGMRHSYMHLRSRPQADPGVLSHMMLGKDDATTWKSASCDWAGGGIVSTTEDLLLFSRALHEGRLLKPATLAGMQGTGRFMDGIHYGKGLMRVRFGDMLFLMAGTPDLLGHSGILSTHMFYVPAYDAHILLNMGSSEDIGKSYELLFRIMQGLADLQKLHEEKQSR